jgi:hypothetical protein
MRDATNDVNTAINQPKNLSRHVWLRQRLVNHAVRPVPHDRPVREPR